MHRLLGTALVPVLLLVLGCYKTGMVSGPLPPLKATVPASMKDVDPAYQAAIAELEQRGGQVQVLGDVSKEPAPPVLGASTLGFMGSPLGQGPFLAASALFPGTTKEPRVAIAFTNTQVSDKDLELLKKLRISSLNLNNQSQITAKGLANLEGQTDLTVLSFEGTPVTDQGLEHLRHLTALKTLTLGEQPITDAGLEHLKGLARLITLQVSGQQITDKGLGYLRPLKLLHTLMIGSPRLTDAGLENLKGLTNLRFLGISSPLITDKGLGILKDLAWIYDLVLSGCSNLTDAGLEQLQALVQIRTLYLENCPRITDAGLKYLRPLNTLRSVNLKGTQVTDAGVRDLQQALPVARISR